MRVALFGAIVLVVILGSAQASALQPTPTPVPTPSPSASNGEVDETRPGLPGSTNSSDGASDATVVLVVEFTESEPPLEPLVEAAIEDSSGDGGGAVSAPPAVVVPCEEYVYNWVENIYVLESCDTVAALEVCGAERVDDVVSGRIAGEESAGRFGAYINELLASLGEAGVTGEAGFPTTASISDILLEQGLGDPPADDLLPVFYWCAPTTFSGELGPIDLGSVSFGWDLTIGEVYDLPGVRADLYTQLQTELDLYKPEPGATPPIEIGGTYVQWKTWFFLHNTHPEEGVYTTNDIDTIRIDLRATLIRIDWAYDGVIIESCTPSEMKVYDPDEHDPVEDVPLCHYRFTQDGVADLTTTIYYEIEEQVRRRHRSGYPDIAWTPFNGTETVIELATTIDDYQVAEIVSVNVYEGAG